MHASAHRPSKQTSGEMRGRQFDRGSRETRAQSRHARPVGVRVYRQALKAVGANCKKLRALKLWACSELSDFGLVNVGGEDIQSQTEELEELDLRACSGIQHNETLCFFLNRCRDIKVLRLKGIGATIDDTVLKTLMCCPDLQVMDISGGEVTSAGLIHLS